MELFLAGLAGVSLLGFVVFLLIKMFYVVVKPNQAHVIVGPNGRKVYSPSTLGEIKYQTSYFYIPLFMQRIIVSLENVKHEINDIKLRDKEVAPFTCDITCWFKIVNPDLAAEKLDVDENGNIMESIKSTLNAQIQGVARAASMEQEVIDLMRNRKGFGENVFAEVNGDLDEWGVQLVKLEIIDFTDSGESHVIQDYEARREAVVSTETRKTVAEQTKEAEVKEAEAKKISQKAKIDSDQEIEMRAIEKQEFVGIRNENARLKVAEQQGKANEKKVASDKIIAVGQAQYTAEAIEIEAGGRAKAEIQLADGKAKGIKLQADADAEAITKSGKAKAEVVAATGSAEAEAIDKKAEAQKKYTDASKEIEMAKIAADIEKTKFQSIASSLQNAKINIVSPDMKFMGFGAEEGAGLGALAKALEDTSGAKMSSLVSAIADKVQNKIA